jgi:DNA replication protein DnaC
MKPLKDIASKVGNNIQAENMPTSLNPNRTIVCFDPINPDQPCPICAGRGVVRLDVPTEDPRWGKLHRCPNMPNIVTQDRYERLRKASNMEMFVNKRFENFQISPNSANPTETSSLLSAINQAQSYTEYLLNAQENIPMHESIQLPWLILKGSYGTGKTHLAAAIGNEYLQRGGQVLFLTAPDLLDRLRGGYSNPNETYDDTFDRLKEVSLLIVDDLGAENPSAWAQEKLFQLLNFRYVSRLFTIITMNMNVLNQLDPRLQSRLGDVGFVRTISITASDFRNSANANKHSLSRLSTYSHMLFETFVIDRSMPAVAVANIDKVSSACYEFARNPKNWLVLTGGYGTGKTHLAAAIANYYTNHNTGKVIFLSVAELIDEFKTTFDGNTNVTSNDVFEKVRDCDLLILDDLSTEPLRPWAQDKLFQVLEHRYITNKPTVITSSASLNELEKSQPRLVSRLSDSRRVKVYAITGGSYTRRFRGHE